MDDEVKFFLGIGSVLVCLVLSIAIPVAWDDVTTINKAMENGYEQVTVPGHTGLAWQKKH